MTPRSRKRGPPADITTGNPSAKRSKTRLLTAQDIPDIVSAVVQALPPQTGAAPTVSSRQTRYRNSHAEDVQVTPRRSSRVPRVEEEEDDNSDHEDFGE